MYLIAKINIISVSDKYLISLLRFYLAAGCIFLNFVV